MKKYFLLFAFLVIAKTHAQNDCTDAIIACGNTDYTGLSANGIGIQELTGLNTCSSNENNSIWIKISINNGGTLGFTLRPESRNIDVDFDFFIFGPNASCSTIGMAIRCSTTNPEASGARTNLTGMNDAETDTSEGPAEQGNSFVKSLAVNSGDTYFLVIDRPEGNSNFSLDWTGTATFQETPNLQIPTGTTIDLDSCVNEFNLETNTPLLIGSQANVAVTYHISQNDALLGITPILNSTTFPSTSSPQPIFARLTNTNTGCSAVKEFSINFFNPVSIPNSTYAICDDATDGDDSNGKATFTLNQATNFLLQGQDLTRLSVAYFSSQPNAVNNIAALGTSFYNSNPNTEDVFIKVTDVDGCFKIQKITFIVKPLPVKVTATLIQCDPGLNPDGKTLFNLNEAIELLTNNDPNLSVSFFAGGNNVAPDYQNTSNPEVITARITDNTTECSSDSVLNLVVNTITNQTVTLDPQCDILGIEDGFRVFNLKNSSLVLATGEAVRFYKNLNDALLEQNAIPDPENHTNILPYSDMVYARVENGNSCSGIFPIPLKVNPLPNIEMQGTAHVCTNLPAKFVTLDAGFIQGNPNNYLYEWSTGAMTPTISVNQPGNYTVKVIDKDPAKNCEKTRTINVLPSNDATIQEVAISDLLINNAVTILLSSGSIGDYVYSIDLPNGPFQTSNYFENVAAGFHTVYVKDVNGCGTTPKEISVLRIPKFFSPNGDGQNDTWDIVGISPNFFAKSKIYIFDRFGKLVADVKALSNGWNGIHEGKPLPASDYWYLVKFDNGRTVRGHFSLVR